MTNFNPQGDLIIYKAVPCAHDQLGNLRGLLAAVEDCFATTSAGVYTESLRAWNTSTGSDGGPYPERGPHKLPGVCSLTWRNGGWEMHLLIRDFLEVIDGLFAEDLEDDFTMQRLSAVYYEFSYTPAIMNNLRLFTLADQEELGNIRAALKRYGIHIKWEE